MAVVTRRTNGKLDYTSVADLRLLQRQLNPLLTYTQQVDLFHQPRRVLPYAPLGIGGAGLARWRAVFDVAGKTPVEDLVSLAPEPTQVVTIANFDAERAGARVTSGGADSRPMEALALVAELLAQDKLVIKVQTFPFDHAAEAYRISQGGHVRGKLVLVPCPGRRSPVLARAVA